MMSRAIFLYIMVLACSTKCTHADVVSYVGNPFDTFISGGAGNGNLTAVVDFSTPLTDGAVLTLSDVSSWSMSAAGRTITSSSASFAIAEFTIGPSLVPTSWGFSVEQNLEAGLLPESIATVKGPTSLFFMPPIAHTDGLRIDDTSVMSEFSDGGPLSFIGSTDGSTVGTWTVIPEPSLFIGLGWVGIAILGLRRRLPALS